MELTKLKDNVLMNQVGGESVRTAMLLNECQVLEFFSTPCGLESRVIDVQKYIFEEFIDYRHEMDRVYKVLDNHSEIFRSVTEYEILEKDDHGLRALINGKYIIVFKDDSIFLEL